MSNLAIIDYDPLAVGGQQGFYLGIPVSPRCGRTGLICIASQAEPSADTTFEATARDHSR